MPQLFARPRTPNDNHFIESLFGSIKTAPQYPGCFLDLAHAMQYFDRYFLWYNTEHYHSGIDYVTPEQCHQGFRKRIVVSRRQKLENQRRARKEVNRLSKPYLTNDPSNFIVAVNQMAPCSVMKL